MTDVIHKLGIWTSCHRRTLGSGRSHLPELYLALTGSGVLIFLFLQAPFQTSDAFSQFARAVELAGGQLNPAVITQHGAGVRLPTSVIDLFYHFWGLFLHRGISHLTLRQLSSAYSLRWSSSSGFLASNNSPLWPNGSTIYSGLLYVPQIFAIELSKLLNLSLLVTYYLVCALNGVCAVAISYVALRIAKFGQPLMLGLLALPMTLSIDFSVSQDALLVAIGALIFAALSTHIRTPPTTVREYRLKVAWLSGLAYVFCVNRPTNLPILLLYFLIPTPDVSPDQGTGQPPNGATWRSWGARVLPGRWWVAACGGFSAVASAATFLFSLSHQSVSVPQPGASIHGQILYQVSHLGPVLALFARSIEYEGGNWIETFLGQLGWNGGGPLLSPLTYVVLGIGLVLLAFASGGVPDQAGPASTGPVSTVPGISDGIWFPATLGVFLLTTLGTMEVLYLSWTPVGLPLVLGVQGRYFLPLGFFAALALVPRGWSWCRRLAKPIIAAYAVATLAAFAECTWLLLAFFWIRPT